MSEDKNKKKKDDIIKLLTDKWVSNDLDNIKKIIETIFFKYDPSRENINFYGNFNENRIKVSEIFYEFILNNCVNIFLNSEKHKVRVMDKNQSLYWKSFSNEVKRRNVLGFPIVYYSCEENEKKTRLYFENFRYGNQRTFFYTIFSSIKDIVFQKLLILFFLWSNNLHSDNYRFDIFELPKKNSFVFKVRDLYFVFNNLDHIVFLSTDTQIREGALKEKDYIFHAFQDIRIESSCEYSSFIKCFIDHFINNLDLSTYSPLKGFPSTESFYLVPENDIIKEGDIVFVSEEENKRKIISPFVVLIADNYSNRYFVSSIVDPRPEMKEEIRKAPSIRLISKYVEKNKLYKLHKCILSKSDYIIGC